MRHSDTATGDQLANALNALGVNFILGGSGADDSLHRQPARLIAALAMSEEARLRLSLIPRSWNIPNTRNLSASSPGNLTRQPG